MQGGIYLAETAILSKRSPLNGEKCRVNLPYIFHRWTFRLQFLVLNLANFFKLIAKTFNKMRGSIQKIITVQKSHAKRNIHT